MTSEKMSRKDKNQNIQVFVRLRPLNQRERDIKSLGVVEVVNNREVVVRQSQQTTHTKKFTFDRAFNPHAKQVEVYQEVVSPLIEEVLAGYNCTVFAYGQTGTGKTHTMVGEHSGNDTTWQNDPLAGIIPRALSQLFDELRISNTEYTVRVSYLELYNEELFDLLASSDDNSKLRIYEDVTRKGSNIVNGLEEITVYNKNEVYKIMAQGQERKRVASTLMNAQSSRSHTVFTIVVHMKENSPEGEELVKVGKLNLVDLAGSENISKAGSDCPAKRERARECVNINQSLLTLGRVITALVERHPHIPYRESKLTRILQESLGGRTKTSIIATISPGHKDLEETMSTLEYAHRAKNIQNKPEINQKMTKKAILKEYAEEIDRLKRDLQAARDKNGVYLANETFTEMTLKQEEQRKEIQELLLKGRALEEERDRMQAVFADLGRELAHTDKELQRTTSTLKATASELAMTDKALRATKEQYEEQKHLVSVQSNACEVLAQQATDILAAAELASGHSSALQDTIDKRKNIELSNWEVTKTFGSESGRLRGALATGVRRATSTVLQLLNGLHSESDIFKTGNMETQEENKRKIEELIQKIVEAFAETKTLMASSEHDVTTSLAEQKDRLCTLLQSQVDMRKGVAEDLVKVLLAAVSRADEVLSEGDVVNFVNQWYVRTLDRLSAVRRGYSCHSHTLAESSASRRQRAVALRDKRIQQQHRLKDALLARETDMEKEKCEMESRLAKQLEDIEAERSHVSNRLAEWAQRERNALEERLAEHSASETQALEERLSKKMKEIEEERQLLEERIAKHQEWQKAQMEEYEQSLMLADQDLQEFEAGEEECSKNVAKYGKEFDEGTSAVESDLEALGGSLRQAVDQVHQLLLTGLRKSVHTAQMEVEKLSSSDASGAELVSSAADEAFTGVQDKNQKALDSVLEKIQCNNTAVIEDLNALSASASELVISCSSFSSRQSTSLEAAQHELVTLDSNVEEVVAQQEKIEKKYLAEEFRLYSPTGKTPSRCSYQFPRTLSLMSPQERILARYRAARSQQEQEDDCVLVEWNGESRSNNGESDASCSDDSTFPVPSPPSRQTSALSLQTSRPQPTNIPTATPTQPAIFKSTSETDIYVRRKQEQGKENPDRSVNSKKPSKLPAPASLKKPLVERNAYNGV